MDARDKLLAEAGLSEMKVILGCFFNRKLQISLSENKFIALTTKVNKLIAKGMTTTKELELTIGQLVWCTPMWDKNSLFVTLLRVFLVTDDKFWTQDL
jgi:hypothetical protein